MKINSPAGKFIITFESLEPANDAIQVTGKFGVWDAKAEMSYTEFWGIVRMAMTIPMLKNMLGSLFKKTPQT